MERTESLIVQVAPDYENAKIQEMQSFGWNLQNRQEIHEKGEVEGRPSYVDSSTYVIKTTVNKYVKLHFARSSTLTNLERIKALEAEYFSFSFPPPPSIKGAGCFTVFGAVGIVAMVVSLRQPGSPGIFGLVMMLVWTGVGVMWLKSKLAKRAAAQAASSAAAGRRQQLEAEAKSLL